MQISPKLLSHCPLCQAVYEDASIHLLGEQGRLRLFHLTCRSCSHAVLAVILEHQNGVRSMGMVTDLEAQDVLRFQDIEPVSADDCLVAHDFLLKKSEDFCRSLMRTE